MSDPLNRRLLAVTNLAVAAAMVLAAVFSMPAQAEGLAPLSIATSVLPERSAAPVQLAEVKRGPWDQGWHDLRKPPHPALQLRLPRVCRVEIGGARRDAVFYSGRCLRDQGLRARLPQGCGTEVRMQGYSDRIYNARCLADAGVGARERARGNQGRPHDRREYRRGHN